MTNMMLATPVMSDAATHTGSAVAAGLPLSNLKQQAIGAVTRFTTPAGAYIIIDLGVSASAVDLVALLGHNASATGTARVRAADLLANITTTPLYDSGTLRLRSNIVAPAYADVGSLERNHFIHCLTSDLTARYWRIDMADAALSYLDVGRMYLSKAFKPDVNMDYGLQEGFIDPSTVRRSVSGRIVPNERGKYRFAELQLSFGSKEEMFGQAFDFDYAQGSTRDVLYIADCEDSALLQKRSIYGRMAALNPVINTYYQLFEKSYRIEEIIE